jgi:hypothetical protein
MRAFVKEWQQLMLSAYQKTYPPVMQLALQTNLNEAASLMSSVTWQELEKYKKNAWRDNRDVLNYLSAMPELKKFWYKKTKPEILELLREVLLEIPTIGNRSSVMLLETCWLVDTIRHGSICVLPARFEGLDIVMSKNPTKLKLTRNQIQAIRNWAHPWHKPLVVREPIFVWERELFRRN